MCKHFVIDNAAADPGLGVGGGGGGAQLKVGDHFNLLCMRIGKSMVHSSP